MTPEFARVVDEVFAGIVDLLLRIEENHVGDPLDERSRIVHSIESAEMTLGLRPEWESAKYALAAWADDVLMTAGWSHCDWWRGNLLEHTLFRTNDAGILFFQRAHEAAKLPNKDALEVYYVCVALGFRGAYRNPNQYARDIEEAGLPADVETWARRVAQALHLRQGRPVIVEAPREGDGAPPLDGKYRLVEMGLACMLLTAVAGLMAWMFYFTSGP
jgi:type VI secretion system protein ImpK